jgi:hypothetical protein
MRPFYIPRIEVPDPVMDMGAVTQREIAIAWRLNPIQKEIGCISEMPLAKRDRSLTARGYRSSWLHLQRIIKSIEIIKQANRSQQLNDLAFVEVLAQLGKELVIDSVGVAGHTFGQPQRGFFFFREVRTFFEISQIVDLFVCPAVPSCQDGV